jgi:hypothetical protein
MEEISIGSAALSIPQIPIVADSFVPKLSAYYDMTKRPRFGFIRLSEQKRQYEIGHNPIINGMSYDPEKRKACFEIIEYYPMLLDLCDQYTSSAGPYDDVMMIYILGRSFEKPSSNDNMMMADYFEPIKKLTHEEVIAERFNFRYIKVDIS